VGHARGKHYVIVVKLIIIAMVGGRRSHVSALVLLGLRSAIQARFCAYCRPAVSVHGFPAPILCVGWCHVGLHHRQSVRHAMHRRRILLQPGSWFVRADSCWLTHPCPDHNLFAGVAGVDIVNENLRELCVWQKVGDSTVLYTTIPTMPFIGL